MYSQNDEEKFILEHFAGQPVGRFYDIGAWNGVKFSNTLALLEQGWSGVSVEPEYESFRALVANLEPHAARLDLVNAAVALQPGLVPFWSSNGDAVSTLDADHRDKWADAIGGMRKYFIQTLTLETLFDTFGQAEFISLDVEGTNLGLFRELPFHWPRLKMIVVEHDSHTDLMTVLAARHGFRNIHVTSENLILLR